MTQQRNIRSKNIDWEPLFNRLQQNSAKKLPFYPGDLKTALIDQVGFTQRGQGEAIYQLAVEISHLTTHCDPEIIYWFSRLVAVIEPE